MSENENDLNETRGKIWYPPDENPKQQIIEENIVDGIVLNYQKEKKNFEISTHLNPDQKHEQEKIVIHEIKRSLMESDLKDWQLSLIADHNFLVLETKERRHEIILRFGKANINFVNNTYIIFVEPPQTAFIEYILQTRTYKNSDQLCFIHQYHFFNGIKWFEVEGAQKEKIVDKEEEASFGNLIW